ncbi:MULTISPECIES: hypothetical protein [Klebsiella]|nr:MULTISPECIES: hypothetical protein [Klebsiella]MBY0741154.1 hypothetical protein [Klebsiella sp. M589]QNE49890.1 hypothetical protein H5403_20915 [Klebsiella michiganensis]
MLLSRRIPGLRRKRLTRATDPQTAVDSWPGSAQRSREEAAPMYLSPYIPGLRRKRLTRATGPQTAVDP